MTRLARQLKREGLLTTLDAVAEVARTTPVRLLLVGDGECRAELAEPRATRSTGSTRAPW